VVLFGFKETITAEQIGEIEAAFAALPEQIEAIHDFEWGTDVSVENRSQGYTHCFLVTFRSEQDRDAYLPHPAHQAFVSLVDPQTARVLVFDYWAQEAS
jgi:hypothetical protein